MGKWEIQKAERRVDSNTKEKQVCITKREKSNYTELAGTYTENVFQVLFYIVNILY